VRPRTRGHGGGASLVLLALLILVATWTFALSAQQTDGPKYAQGTNNLLRPTDYREWMFIGSSLGLNYPPPGQAQGPQIFNNVFVNRSSYQSFMQTGKWPDRTIWVLEFRNTGHESVPDRSGIFQTDLQGMEANVKDSRFPDGWGYFGFGPNDKSAAPLAGDTVKRCIDCHTSHTAVERTFVQFYPTLFEVAKKMGTVKKDYTDP
jgi:hypothetical protein